MTTSTTGLKYSVNRGGFNLGLARTIEEVLEIVTDFNQRTIGETAAELETTLNCYGMVRIADNCGNVATVFKF